MAAEKSSELPARAMDKSEPAIETGLVMDVEYHDAAQAKITEQAADALRVLDELKGEIEQGNALDEKDSKALLRRLDRRILPILLICWFFQSLDKSTLGYASILHMQTETHLVGTEYSWLSSIFYLGFMLFEYPANLILQRFPVGKVLSTVIMLWGGVLMCHAACHTFAGLATVRILLGMLEGFCNPATMILFGMYYRRDEQPFRMGLWISFGGVSYALSGIMAYGIGFIHGSLAPWRVLYLMYGAITIGWGALIRYLLPDTPLKARFLSEEEKKNVVLRINENETGFENKTFKKEQFVEAIKDPKSWLFFLFSTFLNIPNGIFINFQGTIIASLNFAGVDTTLMTMPSGAMYFVSCAIASYFASRYQNARIVTCIATIIPFLAGLIGLQVIPDSMPYGRLVSVWLCWFFPAPYGIAMALMNGNTAGHTKRITTYAMFVFGGGLGSFIGPFCFIADQAPRYRTGFVVMFAAWAAELATLVALWLVLYFRNRARRLERGNAKADVWAGGQRGFLDLTDGENKDFVYVY